MRYGGNNEIMVEIKGARSGDAFIAWSLILAISRWFNFKWSKYIATLVSVKLWYNMCFTFISCSGVVKCCVTIQLAKVSRDHNLCSVIGWQLNTVQALPRNLLYTLNCQNWLNTLWNMCFGNFMWILINQSKIVSENVIILKLVFQRLNVNRMFYHDREIEICDILAIFYEFQHSNTVTFQINNHCLSRARKTFFKPVSWFPRPTIPQKYPCLIVEVFETHFPTLMKLRIFVHFCVLCGGDSSTKKAASLVT